MIKKLNFTVMMLVFFFLTACERRPLMELTQSGMMIPVSFDWSATGIDPKNDPEGDLYRASLWIYSIDGPVFEGRSYKEFIIDHPAGDSILLPPGRFKVLAINNAVMDYTDNVTFRGVDKFETFEYAVRVDNSRRKMAEPDFLAFWTKDLLVIPHPCDKVTSPISNPKTELLNIKPLPVTYTIQVKALVNNIKSSTSLSGRIYGKASSHFLTKSNKVASNEYFDFVFTERQVESDSTGYYQTDFRSLGIQSDLSQKVTMDLLFKLADEYNGSWFFPTPPLPPFQYDETQNLQDQTEAGLRTLKIEVGRMNLPNLNIEGGFLPDIGGWDDEESSEIPV